MLLSNGFIQFVLTILLCLLVVCGKSENKYYRAAVVEHIRFGNISHAPKEILQVNLRTYETAARIAAENGADIIVFPEWGLYPHNPRNRSWVRNFAEDVPDPKKELSNPCTQADLFTKRPTLKQLSCIAYQNGIYLVANMADAKECSNRGSCNADNIESCRDDFIYCPEDETYFYNTNVVFDRQGTLIARYYKRHLFFELDMNTPVNPEDIYFETEFGVFTTFICFDMMYKESVKATDKPGVVNVVYPTYWYDFAPFAHSATSFQQSWAMRNKVNLLAANVHYPRTGTVGSGIYSAENGALVYTHNPDNRGKLLISNVPRHVNNGDDSKQHLYIQRFYLDNLTSFSETNEESDMKDVKCMSFRPGQTNLTDPSYKCFQHEIEPFTFVKLTNSEGIVKKCVNGFCCHLSYKAYSMDEDYFLGVFAGDLLSLKSFSYGFELCFVTRCDSTDGESCTNYVTKSNTIFQHIDLKGNFTAEYVYPTALNSGIRLIDKKQWIFDEKSQIIYHNLNKRNSILFIGLSGRLYDRDSIVT